jgi:Domain of unknown function (DUF305)
MTRALPRRLLARVVVFLITTTALYTASAASGKDRGSAAPTDAPTDLAGKSGAAESEHPFLAENQHAMDKMMAGMAPKPTGDVDTDFAAMMIPHHQGAIDMAVLELRYGRNEQLRRIAQEIIVDQQQEIAAMRLALSQPLPPPAAAPATSGDFEATGAPENPVAHTMKDMPW